MNMETKEIAVVTGASGFVGSHLVDLLLSKGYNVRCIVRNSSNLKWLDGKPVEIHKCGLFDKEGLKQAFKNANYIYHVAGVVKSKKPEGYIQGNVEATRTLLDVALENKESLKRFIYVSSQTSVGPSHSIEAVNETVEMNPITNYGRSKKAAELMVHTYMDKLPITICRPPAVYGERDTEIFIFFQTFSRGLFTTIGMKDKTVSLIHVSDLVNGFYLAAINEKAVGQTYFISSEKLYNWETVGRVTSEVLGKKALHIKVPHFLVYTIAAIAQFFAMFSCKPATLNIEKASDLIQEFWTCDTSKAVRELGYRQETSLEEGIKRTIGWYKENKWL